MSAASMKKQCTFDEKNFIIAEESDLQDEKEAECDTTTAKSRYKSLQSFGVFTRNSDRRNYFNDPNITPVSAAVTKTKTLEIKEEPHQEMLLSLKSQLKSKQEMPYNPKQCTAATTQPTNVGTDFVKQPTKTIAVKETTVIESVKPMPSNKTIETSKRRIEVQRTQETHTEDITTMIRNAETDGISTFPLTPPPNFRDPLILFYKAQNQLIHSLFANDMAALKFQMSSFQASHRNLKDSLGNSLLLIAVRLAMRNDRYYELVRCLLSIGADPRIRDANGWSSLDLAVQARHVKLTATLFEYIYQAKRLRLGASIASFETIMERLPDCYVEVKWKVQSSVPFVTYFAPSDTFKLWKIGKRFRLDSTLAGISGFKTKRRDMSVLFKDGKLVMLNRTKGFLTDMQEPLALDEKKMMIEDLLESTPFHQDVEVAEAKITKERSAWTKKVKTKRIADFNAEKYIVKVEYQKDKREGTSSEIDERLLDNAENYLTGLEKKAVQMRKAEEEGEEDEDEEEGEQETKEGDNSKKKTAATMKKKKATFSIWMSKDYPIVFQVGIVNDSRCIGAFEPFANETPLILKEEIRQVLIDGGFPVKVSVPLSFALKTTVDFSSFKYLDQNSMGGQTEIDRIFAIDPALKLLPRTQANKTLQNQKKRLLMANVITA